MDRSPRRVLRRIAGDRAVARPLAAAALAEVGGVGVTLVWLLLVVAAVDRAFVGGEGSVGVASLVVAMVAVLAVRAALAAAADLLADTASGRLRTGIRARLIDHLVVVGPTGIADRPDGEVAAVVGAGVEALDDHVTRFLPAAAAAVGGPLLVLVAVAAIDPWSTLVLLFTGPMLVLLLAVIGGRTRALTERRFDELAWLSAFYLDLLRGLATLKAFGRSRDGAAMIAGVSRRFADTTMEVLRTAFQTSLVMEWAATASIALVAVQVSFRMVEDDLPFATALAVLVLTPELFAPLRRLALEYHAGQAGDAALARIDELLAAPTPASGASAAAYARPVAPLVARPPAVELSGVSCRYPGAAGPSLDDLDLRLAPGETVALVGPSGAGKTTVARVLLGLVEPERGSVRVDGEPLRPEDLAGWRRSVAWVPQHPTILSGTVADAIRLGAPDADDAAVRAAADLARATPFIERLPDGFATVLGEHGRRLSGGQRRRLAIARAALRDAPFVVLDEPTAHLDADVEREVVAALADLLRDRTALVIAHRAPAGALADRIVHLEHGRVVVHR